MNIYSTDAVPDHWYSFAFAVDMTDQSKTKMFVNGEEISYNVNVFTNDNIGFSGFQAGEAFVGSANNGFYKFDGDIGEIWFDTSYVDLATNNPFWDSDENKPAELGANGELPTGSSPLIYMPMRADQPTKNLGTIGDFAQTGAFHGARGPSEFWGNSAEFDGNTGYLSKSGNSGFVNAKTLTVAMAVNLDDIASRQVFDFSA